MKIIFNVDVRKKISTSHDLEHPRFGKKWKSMKIHNPQAEYLIHELNGERSTHGTRIRLNYYPVTLLGIKKIIN